MSYLWGACLWWDGSRLVWRRVFDDSETRSQPIEEPEGPHVGRFRIWDISGFLVTQSDFRPNYELAVTANDLRVFVGAPVSCAVNGVWRSVVTVDASPTAMNFEFMRSLNRQSFMVELINSGCRFDIVEALISIHCTGEDNQ